MNFLTKLLPYKSNTNTLLDAIRPLGHLVALESASPNHESGRWSIISAGPVKTLTNTTFNSDATVAIESLIKLLPKTSSELPFIGGLIGHASYGFVEGDIEKSRSEKHNVESSKITASLYTWAYLLDHKDKKAYLVYWTEISQVDIETLVDYYHLEHKQIQGFKMLRKFSASWSHKQYEEKFNKIQDYIKSGDTYQINLTQKFNGNYTGSPLSAYCSLKAQSHSPFLAYYESDDFTLASASPELFIQCKGNKITTKPIKGTIPRAVDAELDNANIVKLKESKKDMAENLMITDLLRNDLSIICQNTTTPKLFEIESFETVHHLVSTITAEKPSGATAFSVFKSCFPGGSITGAPKKRAMEIINELEDFSRDLYCGSSFYYSVNENFNSNILIRSFVFKDGEVNCWAGGGVTIDSKWESEYQESLDKISRLMQVLEK
ncbi:MAG: para-aminobenzoate synthetase component 1 [Bermanella sp.]|jgi:para-aminobenzoate synthetase component 1